MLKAISYNICLNRNGYVNRYGERQVVIEVYQPGCRRVLNTNLHVQAADFANGRIQQSHPDYDLLNRQLMRIRRRLMELEDEMLNAGFEPTPQRLIDSFRNNLTHSVSIDKWVESVILPSNRRSTTKTNYTSLLRSLHLFSPDIRLQDITYDLIVRWQNHMRTHQHLSENTISLRLKTLRCLVNEAIRRDVLSADKDPFRNIRIPEITARHEHLTEQELTLIEKSTPPTPRLTHIRDAFLFCCYTGLRWSDFRNLTSDCLTNDILTLNQKKTGHPIFLPLNVLFAGKPLRILHRYVTLEHLANIGDNHQANHSLRIIAHFAGVTRHMHWHLARHTCATLLNQHGLRMQEIQYILGHQKQSTTEKHYAETLLPQVTQSLLHAFHN